MHGRLKVRTTEEERERKKKEQALKVKAYKAAMAKIMSKRKNLEYDDEMMMYTTPILQRNPDVSTLWNIRRECILAKVNQLKEEEEKKPVEAEQEEGDEVEKKVNKEEAIQKVFETEIYLTEQCLLVNPKSYNIWHHRMWLLEQAPQANWQREVLLCNKYLKMDERNFHTWDYRRYVVEKAEVAKQDELDFCTEKIKVNFSNYSSWHHRSLLLPVLYPYEGEAKPKRPMSEEKLKEELEMVLTAAFTDPNDSSAWFYQRWLLGYSQPELAVAGFRCSQDKTVVAFTKPITAERLKLTLKSNDKEFEFKQFTSLNNKISDTVFYSKEKVEDLDDFQQLAVEASNFKTLLDLKTYQQDKYYFHALAHTTSYTSDVLTELKSQLESCESLLEYEPDSKWCLLTSALLMRAIDSSEYHQKSLDHLKQLQVVDPLRENYYKDLASKWILQKSLLTWSQNDENEMPAKLDLSQDEQLTCLTDRQYLVIADEVLLSEELGKRYGDLKTFNKI